MVWVTVGIIVGGRRGRCCCGAPGYYLANPLEIVMIWKGGMAFHGNLIGVIVAILLYARAARSSAPSPSPM
jgi:phosphatidylglycerol:prolipoprotein diacylglycerol transferase